MPDFELHPWERPLGDPQQLARDFETHPYDRQERRAAKFLSEAGVGGGDDPIGFLIASSSWGAQVRKAMQKIALMPRTGKSLEDAQKIANEALLWDEVPD